MPEIAEGDPYEDNPAITITDLGDPQGWWWPVGSSTFKLPVVRSAPGCPGCGINFGENATIGYVCMNVACPSRVIVTC